MTISTRILSLVCFNLLAFGCDADDLPLAAADDAEAVDEADADEIVDGDDLDGPAAGHVVAVDDLGVATARHCVIEAHAVTIGADPADEPAPRDRQVTCFPRFADAIFFATGEQLAADATPDSYEPSTTLASRPQDPAADTNVIHIEFQYDDFGGSSLAYTSSYTCATKYFYDDVISASWQDRISSAKAYAGCNHSYHYENNYQGGAVKDCGKSCTYIGAALQNRTSSLRHTK